HDLKQPETDNLQIIAEIRGEAGDHQRALDYLTRARSIAETTGLASRLGDIARAEAREYAALSRYDLALARARESAAAHRTAGAAMEELNDQLLYAEIAQRAGRPRDADGALVIATALSRKLGSEVAMTSAALGRARIADVAGRSREILDALGKPGSSVGKISAHNDWEVHSLRARALARVRDWNGAITEGRLAVEGVERIRRRIPEGPMRASYAGDKSVVYGDLVIALLQTGRVAEAFEVADAGRGRALLERIGSYGRNAASAGAQDVAESERLLRRIDRVVDQLRQADTIPPRDRSVALRTDLADLSRRLVSMRREYEDRMRRAATADPRAAAILGVSRTHAPAVLNALSPNEVLIKYMATPKRLIVFVARQGQLHHVASDLTIDELSTRVRIASELASRHGEASARQHVLRALYDVLLFPVERAGLLKNVETLVIVPSEMLSAVPFAALVDARRKYLAESHAVLMLSSAAALPALRARGTDSIAAGHAVFAPFPTRLPGSDAEARVVARSVGAARLMVGPAATETALRAALASASIVHVASHAVLNHPSPMFSRVELAARIGGAPVDDGRLEVHELLNTRVRSQLVFLSGCETGAGTAWATSFRRGQDYSTLAQAFLYSGARDVVATLWRIDDRGAAAFAQRFYAALPGRSAASALALAQREMIRHPQYSAPRYWAAYTVSGSGNLEINPQTQPRLAVQ
ncbi:MAG TPA: CHAT domain-containing protein, partial [Gemmatimonadaceae bacterium]|nr:CHAT domain-containing protein [Gemmatimonadaceae bacterium]